MAMVSGGVEVTDALIVSMRNRRTQFPKEYDYGDKKHNVDRIIDDWDRGMQGDPEHRNDKDPDKKWLRRLLKLLELFSPKE